MFLWPGRRLAAQLISSFAAAVFASSAVVLSQESTLKAEGMDSAESLVSTVDVVILVAVLGRGWGVNVLGQMSRECSCGDG